MGEGLSNFSNGIRRSRSFSRETFFLVIWNLTIPLWFEKIRNKNIKKCTLRYTSSLGSKHALKILTLSSRISIFFFLFFFCFASSATNTIFLFKIPLTLAYTLSLNASKLIPLCPSQVTSCDLPSCYCLPPLFILYDHTPASPFPAPPCC